jgi:hypothetical protein
MHFFLIKLENKAMCNVHAALFAYTHIFFFFFFFLERKHAGYWKINIDQFYLETERTTKKKRKKKKTLAATNC